MKLAEALSQRAELQTKVSELKERIKSSSKIQEGDKPTEDTAELFSALDSALKQLETLMFRINKTNLSATADGECLTAMIAKKDTLSMRVKLLQDVLRHCCENADRYSRNEIKYVCTLDIPQLRRQTDEYAKQLRLLDLKIQSLNWTVDLLD